MSDVCGWSGVSVGDNDEVGPLLQKVNEVATAAGVGEVLIVHHIGWEGTHAKGATKLPEWADVIWTYTKDENEIRTLSAVGRGVDLKPGVVQFDDDGELVFGDVTREEAKAEQAIQAAVKYVAKHPGAARAAVYTAITQKMSNAKKTAAVDEAIRLGLLIDQKTPEAQASSLVVNPDPPVRTKVAI